MATTNSKESIKEGLAEMKASLGQKSLQDVLAKADKELKLLKNTTLDIAFTGVSGAGKSSLVNAFRNISDYEEGAAETGVKETTMMAMKYHHPQFPELTLWDLPGIGTSSFKPKDYLEKVNFSRYDFFIIVASERFTVNDTLLASEIRKMNKRFYFVRTKVDLAVNAERRKPKFSETQTLEEIRKYCLRNLVEEGAVDPKVFLISSWHLNMYDFPLLQKTLADDLNDLKRPLLIMAMPAFSREHLQEKKAAMEALIWKKALLSCGVGAIPVPGLSLLFDIGLLVSTMKEFCTAFGLDDDSLRNLAQRVGKPVDVLKSAIKKTPMANLINPELVRSLMTTSAVVGTAMVLEELSDFIPVFGSVFGGVNSFATTFYMLKGFLRDAEEDAENVLAKVSETAMEGTNSEFTEKELEATKVSSEQRSSQEELTKTSNELTFLKNTTLDIAFTGVSKAGKSSLVNAFRNVSDYEEGAAKVGVHQTTMRPERYPHPQFPELALWDLPGIGTRAFEPKEYLEKVNFHRYDFFIIVASECFTVNDAMLASEIRKMNKRFYFVRNKVDQVMDAERRKPSFSETQTLEELRKYCLSSLVEEGVSSPRVFLISSWYLNMYDFSLLQKTLAEDLNDLKRCLLIVAIPAFSREHLREKKDAMEALIWKKALLSCGVGALPIPGLSLVFDIALLVDTMKDFCKAFGLDEDSLNNLAKRVGKPVDVLKSAIKKSPMANQINPEFVRSFTTKSLVVGSALVLEGVSDFIPILGSLVGGVSSFAITYYMLDSFLEDVVNDAESVLAKVFE
ncbi:interferon-inducible GTPase 5-like [Heteronotia binoei]|uniref:interferon-inducible GTPase 5-like n=1 Tax=Heteronotia binoei TaxID=13085 RepID=UPI0029316246|nr:interferon-inducible GTPase 5-like [Heteronotia binoei]